MENRFNGKSNFSNIQNNRKPGNCTNKKYMDHMYCHSSQKKGVYGNMSVVSGGDGNSGLGGSVSPNVNVLTLLNENKQLKSMVILHLDLIQEQSDQLIAKNKILVTQGAELERLTERNVRLEMEIYALQKELQRINKRSEQISSVPPPLAKIQNQPKISNVPSDHTSTNTNSMISESSRTEVHSVLQQDKVNNIIGECDGKLISKIILQKVNNLLDSDEFINSPQSQGTTATIFDDDEEIEEDDVIAVNEVETIEIDEGDDDVEEIIQLDHDVELMDVSEAQQINISSDNNDDDTNCYLDNMNNTCSNVVVNDNVLTHGNHQDSDENKTSAHSENLQEDSDNSTGDSNEILAVQSRRLRRRNTNSKYLIKAGGGKPPILSTENISACIDSSLSSTDLIGNDIISNKSKTSNNTVPSYPISRGKQMPLMEWEEPDFASDESANYDYVENHSEQQIETMESSQASKTSFIPDETRQLNKINKITEMTTESKITNFHISAMSSSSSSSIPSKPSERNKRRRYTYITTPHLYCTREWLDEAFAGQTDNEFLKTDAAVLDCDSPMLEIPKWIEHDFTPSFTIEGTEELSDEIFLKRHAKLELDERRRKKWDVQQIREQRRIERLKRRHYKDQIPACHDTAQLYSFYPPISDIQTIQYVNELPVLAFGETIPQLESGDFNLPWLKNKNVNFSHSRVSPTVATVDDLTGSSNSTQAQQQQMNSSFVFVKRRKRAQNSVINIATGGPITRQRNSTSKTASTISQASTISFLINNPTHSTVTPYTTSDSNVFNANSYVNGTEAESTHITERK